jgi:hypothetical protein
MQLQQVSAPSTASAAQQGICTLQLVQGWNIFPAKFLLCSEQHIHTIVLHSMSKEGLWTAHNNVTTKQQPTSPVLCLQRPHAEMCCSWEQQSCLPLCFHQPLRLLRVSPVRGLHHLQSGCKVDRTLFVQGTFNPPTGLVSTAACTVHLSQELWLKCA